MNRHVPPRIPHAGNLLLVVDIKLTTIVPPSRPCAIDRCACVQTGSAPGRASTPLAAHGDPVIFSAEQRLTAELRRTGRLNILQQFFPPGMFLFRHKKLAARGAGGHELCVIPAVRLGP